MHTHHISARGFVDCLVQLTICPVPLVLLIVDELHTWVAGPMGRVEKQYVELLQVGG